MASRFLSAGLLFGLNACGAAQAAQGSVLADFEATLAAHDSATAALRDWCGARGIADPAQIRARPVNGEAGEIPPELRTLLEIGPEEKLGYRHVRLVCGETVLSEAHNWYVPGRLTPEMNRVLETTETPFGPVVSPLGFTRERLASVRGRVPGCPENTVLAQRAVLKLPDGRPISAVVECYTAASLGES